MNVSAYITQAFEEFGNLYEKLIHDTRTCMQHNQLTLHHKLGITPCMYRKTPGFVDTRYECRTLHCSRVCDAANLYQCDKTSRTLSETYAGLLPYEIGVPSASVLLGLVLAGCSDKPKRLKNALDDEAWDLMNKKEFKFKYKDQFWKLHVVRETGDMAYLNGIHACSGICST